MEGIYYKEGVYVLIDNDTENNICLLHNKYRKELYRYGNRIRIKHQNTVNGLAELTIDGISITKTMNFDGMVNDLPLSTIVSHLNAIEVNGIDAFLENYKQSMEFLYGELKELNQKTESLLSAENDDARIKLLLVKLNRINNLLLSVLVILFSLHTYMKSALTNDKVISTLESIIVI